LDRAYPAPEVVDPVEVALAKALEGATVAGRFDVVAQLARELEARRLAGMRKRRGLDAKPRRAPP
jgi:hypothetical protein